MESQTLFLDQPLPFSGQTYSPSRDGERLSGALENVYRLMIDGKWRTLKAIAIACACTEAGASARLRDYRKPRIKERYPNRGVERRHVANGLWEYRILIERK